MAEKNANSVHPEVAKWKQEQATQRKATRAANRKGEVELRPAMKFALDQVQSARRACEVLADEIKHGKTCPVEVMQACAMLSGAVSSMVAAG